MRKYKVYITLPSGAVLNPRIIEAPDAWNASHMMREKYPGSTVKAKSLDPWIRQIREQPKREKPKPVKKPPVKKKIPEKKTCPQCGTEFQPKSYQHRFCCRDCSNKHNYAEQKPAPKPPVVAECKICGEPFTKKLSPHVYCSKPCQRKAMYQRRRAKSLPTPPRIERIRMTRAIRKQRETWALQPPTLNCVRCETPFIQASPIHKFCSSECRKAALSQQRKDERRARKAYRRCPVCDKEFIPRTFNQRFCNKNCTVKHHSDKAQTERARRRAEEDPVILQCAECDKPFEKRGTTHKFCGIPCQQKAINRRRREKYNVGRSQQSPLDSGDTHILRTPV